MQDIELYWPNTDGTAIKSHTLSEATEIVPADQWKAIMPRSVAMTYESWEWIRVTIEKLCSRSGIVCSKEVKDKMALTFGRVDRAARRAKRRG